MLRPDAFKHLHVLLLHDCPLREIGHSGALHNFFLTTLEVSPVIGLGLHLLEPFLEILLILDETLDFKN